MYRYMYTYTIHVCIMFYMYNLRAVRDSLAARRRVARRHTGTDRVWSKHEGIADMHVAVDSAVIAVLCVVSCCQHAHLHIVFDIRV